MFPKNSMVTHISNVIATDTPTKFCNTRDIQYLCSDYNIKQHKFAYNNLLNPTCFGKFS